MQKDDYNNGVEVLLAEPEARTPEFVGRSFFSTDSERIVTEGWFLRLNGLLKAGTSYSPAFSHLCQQA